MPGSCSSGIGKPDRIAYDLPEMDHNQQTLTGEETNCENLFRAAVVFDPGYDVTDTLLHLKLAGY